MSFCALIVLPAIIWHFDIWMVPAFLILLLTYELVKHTGNNKDQNILDGDEDTDNQVRIMMIVIPISHMIVIPISHMIVIPSSHMIVIPISHMINM